MRHTISLMTRIAGEAQLTLLTDSKGIVTDALFGAALPIRSFEAFSKSKNPLFVVEVVKRICGICHAVQGIAAAMAFEHAMGITVPPQGLLLRELCAIINRLHSHTLAQILLIDDIFIIDESVQIKNKLLQLYNALSDAMGVVGGTPVHSPYITIGGMQRGLTPKSLDKLLTLINRIEELIEDYSVSFHNSDIMGEKYLQLKSFETATPNLLATGIYLNEEDNVNMDLIDIVPGTSQESLFEDELSKSTGLAALYEKQITEVGPRARMTLLKGYSEKGSAGLNESRVQEMLLSVERIREIINEISPDDVFMSDTLIMKPGEGIGIIEAPRGILIHSVKLGQKGRIVDHRIIFPTMFNVLAIQEAVKGLPSDLSQMIVRLYDPCIPCEVH